MTDITVTLTDSLYDRLRAASWALQVDVSDVVEAMLERGVEQLAEEGLDLEAMVHCRTPLGRRLIKLRQAGGWTQNALANRAGLSIATIVAIEGGRTRRLQARTARALNKALGARVQ